MSSKSGSGKPNKRKKTSVSSPKKPVTTVTALFKQQLKQQQTQNNRDRNNTDQESDDESIVFVQEQNKSVYFNDASSQKKDANKEGNSSYLEEETPTHTGDCSGVELAVDNKSARPQQRLSRRLSLKKANQERRSTEEARNKAHDDMDFITVSNQGDGNVECSAHKPNSAQFSSASVGCSSVSVSTRKGGGKSSVLSGPNCASRQQSTDSGGGGEVGDMAASNTAPSQSSSKGKLSLKRKRTLQQDNPLTWVSPKRSRPGCEDETSSDGAPATKLEKEDRCATAPVFSIFKQTTDQDKSRKDSKSSTDHTLTDHKPIVCDPTESPASSITDSSSTETLQGQRITLTGLRDSSKAKDTNKDGSSLPTSTDADAEETEGKAADQEEDDPEDAKDKVLYRVPYYLENFNTIIKSVFADDYYVQLFNEADLCHVEKFNTLSEPSQKLYVRLFSRKLAWLSTNKIKYPEIADDLAPCLEELVTANLLSSGEQLEDLEAMLGALSAPDLRLLAKSYHMNTTGQQKGQIIQTLITKSQQSTVASLFGQKIGGVRTGMLKKAKNLLGPVYRLRVDGRAVFVRALMLFSLINTSGDDDTGSGGQGQLFQMLMVNIGRLTYPAFTVNRQTPIFRSRQDLIRFEEALQLEMELLGHTTSGNWKSAYSSFLTVKEHYDKMIKDDTIMQWDRKLPEFLRYFTAGSVIVRLLNQGIEILQRRKEHAVAVNLIRELLGQSVYNWDLHGYWWDRLALNLDVHLKQPKQALQAIQDGLADPLVRTGHRLSLFLRAEMICSKPKSPFSQRLKDFTHETLAELPKTLVEGRVLPHTLPGSRYQFITEGYDGEGEEEVTMCNVEQIVLDYYKNNGFPQGIHAEGSVVSTLFCLYFWEALFMDVEDAFHSPYQTSPLDLHTDAFYQRRQKTIDDTLIAIENGDEEALHAMVAATWEKHNGVMCAGISWDRFTSVGEVQGLVSCMGGKVLSGILRRYAQQPRHTRGGFPDLTLWNTTTKQLKISEVKGPGDRLSHKQMLWLDHLLKLGVDAEVCHVKPVGVKKLKPISKQQTLDSGEKPVYIQR